MPGARGKFQALRPCFQQVGVLGGYGRVLIHLSNGECGVRFDTTLQLSFSRGLNAPADLCPCGHLWDGTDRCRCSADKVHRYRARVPGPLRDRIDLYIEAPPVKRELLRNRAAQKGDAWAWLRCLFAIR